MKCPKCQFENREGAKFCLECGEKLELDCPQCGKTFFISAKFCDECGQKLGEAAEAETVLTEAEGERKHVTVLFSDLSGYTTMTEKLDPEEVKEIMSRIFEKIDQVITKYEGFIERFVGDAVMAIFGVPEAHEDDPVRAINAAREIHDHVEAMSSDLEDKIGQRLSMHSGINTGLVVTGEVDLEKRTHGLIGNAINLASRLQGLAKVGEILVGLTTFQQAEGYFEFEELEPKRVKGKSEPVKIFKVLSPKERPVTVHRLSGLRAQLIGRKTEVAHLREAVESLREKKGRIFSVCGDAGTGKSRLVDEFKATLDLKHIQWFEGHAYAYAKNIPYFPLIDMLNRVFKIEEGDSTVKVREKVETGIEDLVGNKQDLCPYIGSLYALSYPETERVSSEFLKSRLLEGVLTILSTLAQRTPTVFLLEDLHWADPSFVELLRHALLEIRQPAIVLCVYRPVFSLFTTHQLGPIAKTYREIRLQDLSLSEAQDMLESLLKTKNIPSDLRRFVQDKAEGNPFYLEELVNSLIESETLIRDNGTWEITRTISESDISSTIHGLISGRLDRLEKETKRILQEASVIGRAFLYEILKRITQLEEDIDRCLGSLEKFDLIQTRSPQPELEYVFKHALTQEVVYDGLLKNNRKEIHERIGLVMEQLFQDRLPEYYETLAFHFKRGKSTRKAIDYLVRSGDKSFSKNALEESHQYFKDAFEIITKEASIEEEAPEFLINLLVKWAFVYNRRGNWKELINLLKAHEELVKDLENKEKVGMFYAWLGWSMRGRERLREGHTYLHKALQFAEEVQSYQLIGYACAWLAHNYMDSGLLDEAISYGKRAKEIAEIVKSDTFLYCVVMEGLGLTYFFRGECAKTKEIGETCITYGQKHDIRLIDRGHLLIGCSYFAAGNIPAALRSFEKTAKVCLDPIWANVGRLMLGLGYVSIGKFQEADSALKETLRHSEGLGSEAVEKAARVLRGIILIGEGNLDQGVKIVEDVLKGWQESGSRYRCASAYHMLGKIYFEIAKKAGPKSLSVLVKNIGFLIKNVPFATKKAEYYFRKTIEVSKEIGAKSVLGQAYLDLGLLHTSKKRTDQARDCISNAIQVFEQCKAEIFLEKARGALASLE